MSIKTTIKRPKVATDQPTPTEEATPRVYAKADAHTALEWGGAVVSQRQVARLVEQGRLRSFRIGNRVWVRGEAITEYIERSERRFDYDER
jgi:hypothetical protein